ncbi:hypothetical protein BCR36DRAFT_446820 [Piromyces finnis]|uniref:Uncharacterized protein n=1 Tax=Piromyces finnis TaxID=1754191 RepID=A0A1Y1VC27_9FUNG|nr:hypothetical protein BCR36DRAFT_446820 [Piromyces finnis]|eukprot:ORX51012.1 hypothetical protein BCR36DRAFT_446820 [Piromyces finnis]
MEKVNDRDLINTVSYFLLSFLSSFYRYYDRHYCWYLIPNNKYLRNKRNGNNYDYAEDLIKIYKTFQRLSSENFQHTIINSSRNEYGFIKYFFYPESKKNNIFPNFFTEVYKTTKIYSLYLLKVFLPNVKRFLNYMMK